MTDVVVLLSSFSAGVGWAAAGVAGGATAGGVAAGAGVCAFTTVNASTKSKNSRSIFPFLLSLVALFVKYFARTPLFVVYD